jgi:virginiamycin B lyase
MVRRAVAALLLTLLCATLALAQATGPVFTEYTAASDYSPGSLVTGPDGALWYGGVDKIGRITTAGTVTEYPAGAGYVAALAVGPDGNLWFVQGSRISKMTTAGTLTAFPALPVVSNISSITAGPDGNLWFTEDKEHRIGRITTAGVVTEFPLNATFPGRRPRDITAGADGALWFTENGGNAIGRMTTSGSLTEYPLPGAFSNVGSIAAC